MKSTFKKLPGSVIELEVVLNQKEFEPYWKKSYENALSGIEIKGFRKGAAPQNLAEQAINKDKVFEEAVKNAVRFNLDEIVQENKWTIINTPRVEILENPSVGGLKYKAVFPIFPEVKLGNYKKIAKNVLTEKKEAKIEPQKVEESLKWLLNSRAKIALVDREAKLNDLVNADIEGFSEGKPVAGSKIKGDRFILGEGHFLPGFEEQLINHKAGEELGFSITAPSDYWETSLRNKPIDFKVKINEVFNREMPELNDEFAKSLGPNFKTVKDLEKNITEGITAEKENKEKERLRVKTLDEIIKSSEIDIPEVMIEKTFEKIMTDIKPMIAASGKTEEEIGKIMKERAKNNVSANLIIYKIAEVEKLQPTEEEIAAEQARHAGHDHGHDPRHGYSHEIDEEKEYDYSYQIVQNKKVFEFLENLAK